MTKDEAEVSAIAAFKQGYSLSGGSNVIAIGADLMPRAIWAKATAFAIAKVGKEASLDAMAAAVVVLQTTVGNASQLGMKLKKEGFLKEATATETADSLLEKFRQQLA